MNTHWKLAVPGVAALALVGILSTGCDENAEGAGGNDALVGIWRHTEITSSDTTHEETTQILANGHINTTWADFVHESCVDLDGSWSATDDSVTSVIVTPFDTTTYVSAYEVDATTMTITDPTTGEQNVYTKVAAMVDCDHYGWDNLEEWDGSFTAMVDGVTTNFSTTITVVNNGGTLTIDGYSGVANMAFHLDLNVAGIFTEDNCNGAYIPNMSNPTDVFYATDLNLDLMTSTATQIIATFSFEATNVLPPYATVSVTDGQFALTHP